MVGSRSGQCRRAGMFFGLSAALFANASRAQSLDHDTTLTDAPATPRAGTVRLTGGGAGGTSSGDASVAAQVQWTPLPRLSGDAGLVWQSGSVGPSARLRYQFLEQSAEGLDVAAGCRYKSVGLKPQNGELELLVAVGRRWNRVSAVLDAVYGHESGGPGQDLEAKAFVGYDITRPVRLGLEGRVQAEFVDENGIHRPTLNDVDLRTGPSVAWQASSTVQLQGLVGAGKLRGPGPIAPVAMAFLSVDL